MPIDFFGFQIGKKQKNSDKQSESLKSFVAPESYDGTHTVEAGGILGTYVDFAGSIRGENELINKYRGLALYPECDQAISDIINESVVLDDSKKCVSLNLNTINLSDNIKNKIYGEFDNVLKLLDFKNKAHEIFRRWYVDSKLYYHILINESDPSKGIQELRPINPTMIKKIRKVNKQQQTMGHNAVPMVKNVEEFFIYKNTDKDSIYQTTTQGVKIHPDSICYVHSGMVDTASKRVVGYLQKAIRPMNMLRQIEDAVVIYRISRAPERRIFYVDVGNLPKQKAEQYLRSIMNRYRTKMVYDPSTGETRDDRNHMHMLEDYWLPRREGGRGTEISTLDGGQNLGEMEDVDYLLRKVYRSLNVPISRMEPDSGFNMGRSAEITRDEVKFFKFIEQLRTRFSNIFVSLLKTQLVLKGILTEDDWKNISQDIDFTWTQDSYFSELKETEIMKERLDLLSQMEDYIGRYYSTEWIKKNILRQSQKEIDEMQSQIDNEKQTGEIPSEDDMMGTGEEY
tara:strand:+ start:11577 stop:13112 length:1536 start_codon:yes stop_codon:yes gene_type:complete